MNAFSKIFKKYYYVSGTVIVIGNTKIYKKILGFKENLMEDKVIQRYNHTRNKNIKFLKLTHA